jgi:NADH-quinone oxidoreductase subunit N
MPPLAGFFGKVYVFSSALSVGQAHPHQTALIVLAVIGVINSAIAAAYYLRIVATCYLREPTIQPTLAPRATSLQIAVLGCCVLIILIGLSPERLLRMSRQSVLELQADTSIVVDRGQPASPLSPKPRKP